MSNDLKDNPFAQLFSDVKDVETYVPLLQNCAAFLAERGNCSNNSGDNEAVSVSDANATKTVETPENVEKQKINCLFEEIFLFTLSKKPLSFSRGTVSKLLYLKELAVSLEPEELINVENLEQALFERLLIEDPESFIVSDGKHSNLSTLLYVAEKECITYLFNCFMKIVEKKRDCDDDNVRSLFKTMTGLIIRNVATALKQPALYEEFQELNKQVYLLDLCFYYFPLIHFL